MTHRSENFFAMCLKNDVLLAIIKIYILLTVMFKYNDMFLCPHFKDKLYSVTL